MSAVDSTEPFTDLRPAELEAARGNLPDWTRATPERRAHMGRVAALLEEWAHGLELSESEALRWAAAGWLHDTLRDADPADLIHQVDEEFRDLPGALLHGPAAARRLGSAVDPRVADAVRYHTIGHPRLDDLGRALYLADFLEPGRGALAAWRTELRSRMPAARDEVLVEVVAARIRHQLEKRQPIRPETAAFWSLIAARGGG
jgi:HD superfamily phosphohydrolase YqeK